MKKLFFFSLLLLLFSIRLQAQQNSAALSFGPNMVYYLTNQVQKNGERSPIGYSIGLDFARNLHPQWQLKLGVRYCFWQVPILFGPLQWPSEHNGNGGFQYDPSLPHFRIKEYTQSGAIQVMAGVRWQSKPTEFHWIACGEFGFSQFPKNDAELNPGVQPVVGASFGAEWSLNPKLHLFAQPGASVVFRDFNRDNALKCNLLNPKVDLGVRYAF